MKKNIILLTIFIIFIIYTIFFYNNKNYQDHDIYYKKILYNISKLSNTNKNDLNKYIQELKKIGYKEVKIIKEFKSFDIKNGINLKNNFIQTYDDDGNIILYNTNGICLSLHV